jgi:hypothetical protein
MPDDDACYLLASWARQITIVILQLCRDARKLSSKARSTASQIATCLQIASPYIDSLPRYWVEPELEKLCLKVLKKLAEMCAVCHLSPAPVVFVLINSSGQIGCMSPQPSPSAIAIKTFSGAQPMAATP